MDSNQRKMESKERWKGLMRRTLSNLHRRKALPQEWQKFSDLQTNLLIQIDNPEVTYAMLQQRFPLLNMFQTGSSEYVHLCIRVCFDANPKIDKNEKFLSLYLQILDWIRKDSILVVSQEQIEQVILCHMIECENANALRVMLSLKDGDSNFKGPNNIPIENIATTTNYDDSKTDQSPDMEYNFLPLIRACEKNNFNIIQILVSTGYRLKIFFKKDYPEGSADNLVENDALNQLKIMKMSARSSYIMACYLEALDYYNSSNKDPNKYLCSCYYDLSRNEMHYCPANDRFAPKGYCRYHIECCDPLFRCFDLAKWATSLAKQVSEYREEYTAISQECMDMSVKILEQCMDTHEVETLLKEPAGANKYLRKANYFKYPRLCLALEHKNREFVGHMYCQQMLRQQWYCGVEFETMSFIGKIFYVLKQVFMIPFHSEYFLLVEIGKFLHSWLEDSNARNATENVISDDNEDKKDAQEVDLQPKHGLAKRALLKYAQWANSVGLVKMGIPFNRFIAFSASYLCFLLIIVTLIFKPIFVETYNSNQDLKHNTILRWTNMHYVILFYILALLEKDFEHFYRVKSVQRVLSNFWRVYDLTFHLFFLLYLFLRIILQLELNVDDCIGMESTEMNHVSKALNITSIPPHATKFDCWIVKTTLSISGVLFAAGSTMAFLRILYWFQISETFGPVVLNITRVFTDLFTVMSTYLVWLIAFSISITYLTSTDSNLREVSSDSNQQDDDHPNYKSRYVNIALALFWSTVSPGPNDDYVPAEGIHGVAATTLFILYQTCTCIILMNLLIAIMNSTMQRQENKKLLYWKFARSSVWIEYYNDSRWGLPPPLNVALFPMFFIGCVHRLISFTRQCWKKNKHRENRYSITGNKECKMSPKDIQRRKEHAALMKELVHRYIKSSN